MKLLQLVKLRKGELRNTVSDGLSNGIAETPGRNWFDINMNNANIYLYFILD